MTAPDDIARQGSPQMPPANQDQLPANDVARPIADRIAREVMRWKPLRQEGSPWMDADGRETGHYVSANELGFNPHTDIAHAWLVVEEMRRRGYAFSLATTPGGAWTALFEGEQVTALGTADTAALAICKASLSALEKGK